MRPGLSSIPQPATGQRRARQSESEPEALSLVLTTAETTKMMDEVSSQSLDLISLSPGKDLEELDLNKYSGL